LLPIIILLCIFANLAAQMPDDGMNHKTITLPDGSLQEDEWSDVISDVLIVSHGRMTQATWWRAWAFKPDDIDAILSRYGKQWARVPGDEKNWIVPGTKNIAIWDGWNTLVINFEVKPFVAPPSKTEAQIAEQKAAMAEWLRIDQLYSHQFIVNAKIFEIIKSGGVSGVLATMLPPYLIRDNYMPWGYEPDKPPLIFIKNYPTDGAHPDMLISPQVAFDGTYTYTTLFGGDEVQVPQYTVPSPDHRKEASYMPPDPNAPAKTHYSTDDLVPKPPNLP
jgi:hypothetical protein